MEGPGGNDGPGKRKRDIVDDQSRQDPASVPVRSGRRGRRTVVFAGADPDPRDQAAPVQPRPTAPVSQPVIPAPAPDTVTSNEKTGDGPAVDDAPSQQGAAGSQIVVQRPLSQSTGTSRLLDTQEEGNEDVVPAQPMNTIGLRINPAPIPEGVRRLKMVHFCDLIPNFTVTGHEIPNVPKYKTAFGNLFDQNSGDRMFDRGGPVISVLVPGENQRAAADFHAILCDMRCCKYCKDSSTSTLYSGVTRLMDWKVYQGLPFVHRRDVERLDTATTANSIFRQHWSTDYMAALKVPQGAQLSRCMFFEGGNQITQQMNMCKPKECSACTPDDEAELSLVHRNALTLLPAEHPWMQREDNEVTFACSANDLGGHDQDAEWYRGGAVMKVYVNEDELAVDVMICQYQACALCTDEGFPTRPYTAYRVPFVHRRECTQVAGIANLRFDPIIHNELYREAECIVERRLVAYSAGRAPGFVRITSAVCVEVSCPVCTRVEEETLAVVDGDGGTV